MTAGRLLGSSTTASVSQYDEIQVLGSGLNFTGTTLSSVAYAGADTRWTTINTNDIYLTTTTGVLGIGTNNPQYALDIQNSTGSSGKPFIRLGNTAGGSGNTVGIIMSPYSSRTGGAATQIWAIDDGNASAHLALGTAPAGATSTLVERMRIKSDGAVGIGTNNPTSRLHFHINALDAQVRLLMTDNSTTAATNRGFAIYKNDDHNGYLRLYEASKDIIFTTNSGTNAAQVAKECMRIKSTGKVIINGGNTAIGNIDPLYKLHIDGDTNTTTEYYRNGIVLQNYLFNNNGNNHGTYTDFNTPAQFGYNYIVGTNNSPSVNNATQYYSWTIGLGAEYGFGSGNGSYGAQFALPRNVTNPYLCVRYREANNWGGWQGISSIYSNSSGYATYAGGSSEVFSIQKYLLLSATDNTVGSGGNSLVKYMNVTNHWKAGYGTGNDFDFYYNDSLRGFLQDDVSVAAIDFTGQHRCISDNKTIYNNSYIGYIVSSDGNYIKLNSVFHKDNIIYNIDINEALPVVSLSQKSYDKSVYGVISLSDDEYDDEIKNIRKYSSGAFVSVLKKHDDDSRLIINGCGEGSIWVSDYNGSLENGDYITTSPIVGIGMKQDDDLLHSYTVAKITMDCDFNPSYIPIRIIKQQEYYIHTTSNIIDNSSNIENSNITSKIDVSFTLTSNMLDENGNLIYEYQRDTSNNIVYDYKYKMKYIKLDGNIVDKIYYETNKDHTYRMAFVGCVYKCS